jgi:hypothetical protein
VLAGLAFLYLVTLRKATPAPQAVSVTSPAESVGSELDQL